MKVKFKGLLNGYTGVVDDIVIYYMKGMGRCVVRSRPVPHRNVQQKSFQSATRNIYTLNPSQGYRDDLSVYLAAWKMKRSHEEVRCIAWNNVYNKLMFAMQDIVPDVNLKAITREEVYTRDLPCINVKRAVEAGLLPVVAGYEELTQEM